MNQPSPAQRRQFALAPMHALFSSIPRGWHWRIGASSSDLGGRPLLGARPTSRTTISRRHQRFLALRVCVSLASARLPFCGHATTWSAWARRREADKKSGASKRLSTVKRCPRATRPHAALLDFQPFACSHSLTAYQSATWRRWLPFPTAAAAPGECIGKESAETRENGATLLAPTSSWRTC